MNQDITVKAICAVVFSCMFSWTAFSRFTDETGTEYMDNEQQRYLPYIPAIVLPVYLIASMLFAIPRYGIEYSLETFFSMSFGIFLHISIFYGFLFLLIPILRKRISSRACAMLWVLPNYLYITHQHVMQVPYPVLILHIPGKLLWIILGLWLCGFLFVIGKSILEHLIFRKSILRNSKPVLDSEVLSVWNQELTNAGIKNSKYKVVISQNVTTPLSIGFFRRSIRIVLPDKQYTQTELELIFRHEIIHICRGDSENKFFLVFCCAMFWFNPLMWIAKRKCSNDLELSCDETVLLECDDAKRNQYAQMILNTAGDERGFTTCLSATASALQYRLKHIVHPGKRSSGALVVGMSFFMLCMTFGYVAISYNDLTGQQVIYQTDDGEIDPRYSIFALNTTLFQHNGFLKCKDEDALEEYLSNLQLSKLLGNYSMPDEIAVLSMFYESPIGNFDIGIWDQYMSVIPLGKTTWQGSNYYIHSEIDWEYIASLLYSGYIQDSALPFPPEMEIISNNHSYSCPGKVISHRLNGDNLKQQSWWESNRELIIRDLEDPALRLIFTHVTSNTFTVSVTDQDGKLIKEYSSDELTSQEFIPLEPVSAHYTVQVPFQDENSSIVMEYNFSVIYSGS